MPRPTHTKYKPFVNDHMRPRLVSTTVSRNRSKNVSRHFRLPCLLEIFFRKGQRWMGTSNDSINLWPRHDSKMGLSIQSNAILMEFSNAFVAKDALWTPPRSVDTLRNALDKSWHRRWRKTAATLKSIQNWTVLREDVVYRRNVMVLSIYDGIGDTQII